MSSLDQRAIILLRIEWLSLVIAGVEIGDFAGKRTSPEIFVGLCYLVMSYGILYVFKSLEYRLSGHLRAGPTIKAAPAEEALAVR